MTEGHIDGRKLRRAWRFLCGGAMALLLVLGPGPAVAEAPVAGAITDAALLQVLRSGDWPAAEAAARARLARNPDDVGALVVLARALRGQGDAAGAKAAATRANAQARTQQEKYVSAVEMAAASYDLGHPFAAQLWQRRAIEMAPNDAVRASSVRDYRVLSAANPWSFSVNFDAGASSNVNNGSLADTVDIGGIDFTLNPDAKALSGYEISLSLKARYKFAGFGELPASFGAQIYTKQVVLSGDAKDSVPDARGSDYAFNAVEATLGQALSPADAPLRYRVDLLAGKNWYGGDDLSNYLRVSGSAQWGDPRRSLTQVTLSGERQLRLDNFRNSANVVTASLSHHRRLEGGDRLGLSFALRDASSEAVEIDHRAMLAGVSYDFAKPLAGTVTVGAALELERRDYDATLYGPGARRDTRGRLALQFGFPKLEFYGISPTLRLEGEETRSNVDFYDSSQVKLRLGLRSNF
ncbi:surface lipoprotein assembly modifier [Thioclava sp. DLFJ5-1]|uniref:surface lipoprotein assembly modifier n=1 Tax=Thioclava sp. DLFJ5-1 TaxID=1915314 RepID=UPI00099646C7|nr:surface lipoprotein assembly modifier [Thioclava sp. DLFJ5-1]